MRKVVAYELLSLDAVAEQPDEFVTEFDDVMRENLGRVIAAQDAVLLGRRTYDDWAAFWPTSDIEPFASFINGVQKFVVTSTPPRAGVAGDHARRGRPRRFRSRAQAAARRRHRDPREHLARLPAELTPPDRFSRSSRTRLAAHRRPPRRSL